MSRINSIKVQMTGGMGFILDARLDLPPKDTFNKPIAYAIFCHCFTCTKETLATYRISRLLAQQGIAVLRFDFTGLGQSGGAFEDTNFTSMVNDILAANHYLHQNYAPASILLGHSLGGTAVLAASVQLPQVTSIVTIAAPSNPAHVLHHFGTALAELEKGVPASFSVAGVKFPMKPHFINDVRNLDAKTLFRKVTTPALIFSALNDEVVEPHNAKEIHQWVSGKTKMITLATANHLISDVNDAQFITNQIISWMKN